MKRGIFITLIAIIILFSFFFFLDGSKAKVYDDIIISDISSSNVQLNNILKNNYLLIDSSLLDKTNEIDLTLYNNSLKYDFYATLSCNENENYVIKSNLYRKIIKGHENITGKMIIDVTNDIDSEFIKCYINVERK